MGAYNYAIKNGKTGILVSNKVEEWLDAIEKLTTDNNFKEQIINEAFKDVLEKYNLDTLGKKLYNIMEELWKKKIKK